MARKEGKKAKGAGARALASVAVTLRVTTTPAALNAPLQGASHSPFRLRNCWEGRSVRASSLLRQLAKGGCAARRLSWVTPGFSSHDVVKRRPVNCNTTHYRANWVPGPPSKLLPFSPDSVVTHGDFSLDNLIFDEGKLIGCIDVGRVGIADRYQDLAILWNCLGEFSPSLQKRLFQKYGIDNPDMNKLQFHLMLDEFF